MYANDTSRNRMKTPPNRMAKLEEPEPDEDSANEPLPSRDRGVACKWCKVVGRNVVRKTYPSNIRIRFCQNCRREFMTTEVVG